MMWKGERREARRGHTLGLVYHGVDEDDADEAARSPDEEHFCAEASITWSGIDEVRRCVRCLRR
jgi:hypothetical protein